MRFEGDPDELPPVAAALLRYGGELGRHRNAVDRACADLSRAADAAVSRLEGRLRAARARLAAVDPEDGAALAAAQREVEEATTNRDTGLEQRRRIDQTVADLRARSGPRLLAAVRTTEQGRSRLLVFWQAVDRAVSAFDTAVSRCLGRTPAPIGMPAAAGGVSGPAMRGVVPPRTATLPPLGPGGHVLVPLDLIDDSDSSVRSAADFQKVSMRVMRDGLLRLQTEIIPAVRGGEGLEAMRERDVRTGLGGAPASYVRVYEAFFGDTSVKLSRSADGRYTVRNGYHRIWLAKQAGLDVLPADVAEEP
ncbi:Uncharacterised protein [Amycolatopsis camponoti]|uniref:Uncharacterized protein n=1 Tax=Amycolatopsis camponoti TaxID=2606593 RepID=A0A6I8LU06_9PSEU|nr:hypothetical protein [Amycolatopsis camponoti]VVJ18946.1 Uncharacterised protein [Amycolatopsis camponoti]